MRHISMLLPLGLCLAQPIPQANCLKHVDLSYCQAKPNQTLAYTAHTPRGFSTVLFAEEAQIDGVKQTDFAGKLAEGSKVVFRNGIVLVMPSKVAEVLELQAELYAQMDIEPSRQQVVVCPRIKLGDACEADKLSFQPWSVGIRIVRNEGSVLGYAISFRSRDASSDARHALPSTPLGANESPSIWIVLSQQTLSRFYQEPQDMGNCRAGGVCG